MLAWHTGVWQRTFGQGAAVPQSLLLCGSAGAGLDEFAMAVARALLCGNPDPGSGAACGSCTDCRWSGEVQHPDLVRLGSAVQAGEGEDTESPQDEPAQPKAKGTASIAIAEIRELTGWFQVSPQRERARVAVLNPAESMNLAAANALLKLLEEPQGKGHLVLVSRAPARLPATIRSRCRMLRLPRPATEEALGWLEAEQVASPELALAQTGGAPLAARDLPPAYWALRQALLPKLALGAQCPPEPAEGELGDVIGLLQTWCVDLAEVRAGAAPRHHPDFARELGRLAPAADAGALFAWEKRLKDSRRSLGHPLNPRLVAEALLASYAQLFTEA